MEEIYKEIDQAEKCVIEFEDYYGNTTSAYLVDLKSKSILDSQDSDKDQEARILMAMETGRFEDFVKSFPELSLADVDGDYLFDTDYDLVRLQKNEKR